MRRVLVALGLAVLVLGATIACFLAFEPALGPAFANWPGLGVQWLMEQLGVRMTNRLLPWASLGFWWLAFWVVLSTISRRTPSLPNPAPHSDARDAAGSAGTGAARAGELGR
jgi:hypothetical protein